MDSFQILVDRRSAVRMAGVATAAAAVAEEPRRSAELPLAKRGVTSPKVCPPNRNCHRVVLHPSSSPARHRHKSTRIRLCFFQGNHLTIVSIVLALSVLVLIVVSEAVLDPMTTTFGTVRQLRLPPADLKCNLRSAEAAWDSRSVSREFSVPL